MHMQFIGISETVDSSSDFSSDERLEEIIGHVHKLSGWVTVLNGDIKLEHCRFILQVRNFWRWYSLF